MRLSILASAVLATLATATAQTTRLVPSQFPTIQAAIDASSNGDTVLVLPGTYTENVDNKGLDLKISSVAGAAATTINGNATAPCVVFRPGTTRMCVLDGFSLTNGLGIRPGTLTVELGGGILLHGASPTIKNCRIHGNSCNAYGGGIGGTDFGSSMAVAPLIEDCLIENNGTLGLAFASGGGIALTGFNASAVASVAEVRRCTIRRNRASARGAGIYFGYNHSPLVEDCVLTENETLATSGSLDGGAAMFFALNSVATVRNNRIFRNISNSNGGGIKIFNVTGVIAVNNTIANNVGGSIAGFANGGSFGTNVRVDIANAILWDNGPTEFAFTGLGYDNKPPSAVVTFSDIKGGFAGAGNINVDPRLANAASGNHRLLAGSPCADTGDNTATGVPTTDFEGDTRPLNGTVDMGADERNAAAAFLYADRGTIPATSGGTIHFKIEGGAARGGMIYVLLPGLSGTKPGIDVGGVHLPLNVDNTTTILFSAYALTFAGFLDGAGNTSTPTMPLGTSLPPALVGQTLSFAAFVITPGLVFNGATNDENVDIVQ
jgi:hypothetical protein